MPTVAEVLAMPAFKAGAPQLAAGAEGLDAPVRWVHVVEARDVAELLDGHELLLATGVGWPNGDGWMAGYIASLAAARVAGLVLELGTRYTEVPEALAACCATHGLPLVALHRRVKFVGITEAVHGRIIAEQMAALQARDEVHALFSELSLRGSPANYIVEQLASVLGSAVVLENMAHQVVAFGTAGQSEDEVLHGWEARSRSARRARPDGGPEDSRTSTLGTEGWLVTPVEARGTRWGYLVAFAGPPHPAGRALVLEQAAVALSLSRLADGTDDDWTQASQHWLLASLLQGRYRNAASLASRFEAMGLPVAARNLCGMALRPAIAPAGSARPQLPAAAEVSRMARSLGVNAVSSVIVHGGQVLLVALSMAEPGTGRPSPEAVVDSFAGRLLALAPGGTVAAGPVEARVGGLAGSLAEALEVLAVARGGSVGTVGTVGEEPAVHRAEDRQLRRLLGQMRHDPRLQSYLEHTLGVLLDHDAAQGTDLMKVLKAFLAHPGNRTRAAAGSHLSRSVFYQRLDLIADLLDVDLADGETVAGLHTAMIAREATQGRRQAR